MSKKPATPTPAPKPLKEVTLLEALSELKEIANDERLNIGEVDPARSAYDFDKACWHLVDESGRPIAVIGRDPADGEVAVLL